MLNPAAPEIYGILSLPAIGPVYIRGIEVDRIAALGLTYAGLLLPARRRGVAA